MNILRLTCGRPAAVQVAGRVAYVENNNEKSNQNNNSKRKCGSVLYSFVDIHWLWYALCEICRVCNHLGSISFGIEVAESVAILAQYHHGEQRWSPGCAR